MKSRYFGKQWNVGSNSPYFRQKLISEANVMQVYHHNNYLVLLYCKTDLKLACKNPSAILVEM